MRKTWVLAAAVFSLCSLGFGQERPSWEIYLGYQWTYSDYGPLQDVATAIASPYGQTISVAHKFSMTGANATLQKNIRKRWSAAVDIGGMYTQTSADLSRFFQLLGYIPPEPPRPPPSIPPCKPSPSARRSTFGKRVTPGCSCAAWAGRCAVLSAWTRQPARPLPFWRPTSRPTPPIRRPWREAVSSITCSNICTCAGRATTFTGFPIAATTISGSPEASPSTSLANHGETAASLIMATMPAEMKRVGNIKEADLLIRRSGIHGCGCYTLVDIPEGAHIVEYTGPRITKEQADELYGDRPDTYLFCIGEGDSVVDGDSVA